MKTAIYIRVSTDEQAHEGYSMEVQEEFLRKYAQNNGWEIYCPNGKIYADEVSGYSLNRPALRQLLIDAEKKKFDLVIVYKVDRFSRRLQDLLNLVDELESYGIALKSATEPYDTTSSAGKLMFQQLGSFAEFERNRIVERVLPGMQKSLERGNWQGGKPPYGYVHNKEKKLLEIHPEEAKVVKLIYSMYLNNRSISYIAGYLYEHGYKTRVTGKFYPTLVCDILKNKIYLGKLEWGRRTTDKLERKKTGRYKVIKNDPKNIFVIQGKHETLISQEDFDLVQQKLVANRKGRLCRNRNAGYSLTGILYCGECNHRFRGANVPISRKTTERKRYYRCCGNVEHKVNCQNPSFRGDGIESIIFDLIRRIVEHSKTKKGRARNILRNDEDHSAGDLLEEAKVLKNKLKANQERQKELWRSRSDGLMSYEVYKDESVPVMAEQEQINKDLAKLDLKMIKKERSEEYHLKLRKVIAQYHLTRQEMDLMTLKESMQIIFKSVIIKNKKIVKMELFEPFDEMLAEIGFDVNAEIPIGKDCSYDCSTGGAHG